MTDSSTNLSPAAVKKETTGNDSSTASEVEFFDVNNTKLNVSLLDMSHSSSDYELGIGFSQEPFNRIVRVPEIPTTSKPRRSHRTNTKKGNKSNKK
jgi:hypothetical protein